jgi:hypothetical protein
MSDRKQLDQRELFSLLGQLKNKEAQYPAALLAARRAGFVAQVAALPTTPLTGQGGSSGSSSSGSSGSSTGSGGSAGSGGSSVLGAPAHAIETALQYVLAGILTVMAGTVAYVYQDEIRDLLNPPAPTAEVIDFEPPTATPVDTSTAIPTSTPSPTVIVTFAQPTDENGLPVATPTVVVPTPEPPTEPPTEPPPPTDPPPTPTDPGLHLGQTKTPKPTKAP